MSWKVLSSVVVERLPVTVDLWWKTAVSSRHGQPQLETQAAFTLTLSWHWLILLSVLVTVHEYITACGFYLSTTRCDYLMNVYQHHHHHHHHHHHVLREIIKIREGFGKCQVSRKFSGRSHFVDKKRFFTLAMWINSTQQSKQHQQVLLIDSTKGPILSTSVVQSKGQRVSNKIHHNMPSTLTVANNQSTQFSACIVGIYNVVSSYRCAIHMRA